MSGKGRRVMVDRQDALGLPLAKPLDEAEIQGFAATLRGDLIRPQDDRYGAARAVFNAMVDRRPALIVRCVGVSDVMRGVEFARFHDVPLSIHGGGHSVAGKAVCEGGLMLDLSPMKGIRVDPARRTAEAQAGLTLGAFDHETQAFGLATTLGVVSVTGCTRFRRCWQGGSPTRCRRPARSSAFTTSLRAAVPTSSRPPLRWA